jgi:hypothetical protein
MVGAKAAIDAARSGIAARKPQKKLHETESEN